MSNENQFEVTATHREIAMIAMGVTLPYGKYFITTGEDPSNIYPITIRFSKALAKIEYETKVGTG